MRLFPRYSSPPPINFLTGELISIYSSSAAEQLFLPFLDSIQTRAKEIKSSSFATSLLGNLIRLHLPREGLDPFLRGALERLKEETLLGEGGKSCA